MFTLMTWNGENTTDSLTAHRPPLRYAKCVGNSPPFHERKVRLEYSSVDRAAVALGTNPMISGAPPRYS